MGVKRFRAEFGGLELRGLGCMAVKGQGVRVSGKSKSKPPGQNLF